jgi:predicted amidohydrolase
VVVRSKAVKIVRIRVAAYQGWGVRGDAARALAVMRRVARRASEGGARLVVFPELFLCGYALGEDVARHAERADGPAAAEVARIAAGARISILYGYPERAGARIYNSARLIDRSGRPVANYRKTHLYGAWERRVFAPGDALVTAEIDGLRLGILICYDVEFPETVRALALAGTDLAVVPTALIRPFDGVARTLVPARALENQVYVAYAGLCGAEGDTGYCGLSCIVGPDGMDIARAGRRPKLLLAELDTAVMVASRRLNPYLIDRRPGLYGGPITPVR